MSTSDYSGSIKLLVENIFTLLKKIGITINFLIEDETINKGLDYIANYNKIIVTFDIEFHNLVENENSIYQGTLKNNKFVVPFIREIGMIILVKNNNGQWVLLGNIFVNFNNDYLSNNIIYVLSKYASVNDDTRHNMEKNDTYFNILESINQIMEENKKEENKKEENKKEENKKNNGSEITKEIKKILKKPFIKNTLGKHNYSTLKIFIGYLPNVENINDKKKLNQTINNIKTIIKDVPYSITRNSLTLTESKLFDNQMNLYYKDAQVKKRTITKNHENELFVLLSQIDKYSCYLVKGKMDIYAIKNHYYLLNNTKCQIQFNYIYDIEIFNKFSHDKYGSAQLEKTFYGISKTELYTKYLESFFDNILNNFEDKRAHNPLTDSLYTLMIALLINISLFIFLK